MSETRERICVGCNKTDESIRLESCTICGRYFCADCAHRAGFGRKFCSAECAHAYYFTGDSDDDEDDPTDD